MAFSGWTDVRLGTREASSARVWLVLRGSFAMWDTHAPPTASSSPEAPCDEASTSTATFAFASLDRGASVESLRTPTTLDDLTLRLGLPDHATTNFPSTEVFFSFCSPADFDNALTALNAAVRHAARLRDSFDAPHLYERRGSDPFGDSALLVVVPSALHVPIRAASVAGHRTNHNARFVRRGQPHARDRGGSA